MPCQVTPSKDQYHANIYENIRAQLTAFIGKCHEDMMVSSHQRDIEKGEGRLKFEVSVVIL